jgi:multiple sugar transport system ATP-binding protein
MARQIKVENLRKEFGSIVAADNLTFTISAGEFVTFVGPSGCGKTTTLRMIAGLETPTSGTIHFDDEDVTEAPPQERELSMVFQNIALYPHMSNQENIGYGLKIKGVPKDEREQRINEAARKLQIEDQLDKVPTELSGGQQQRVALGRAFVEDPEILLLDEPMSDLDAKLKEELRVEVQRLHKELDTTFIYVTHDQNEAMTMSDRIVLLRDGQLEQFADPEELFHQPVSEYATTFIGTPSTNVLEYDVSGTEARRHDWTFPLPDPVQTHDLDKVRVGLRPQYLSFGEGDVAITVEVDVIEPLGTEYVVHTTTVDDGTGVDVVADEIGEIVPGDVVTVSAALDDIHVFNSDGNTIVWDDETPEPELESDISTEGTES